jgi:hypothetical protein
MNATALSPWRVDEPDFFWSGSTEEKLRFVLNYTILVPSSHKKHTLLEQTQAAFDVS